MTYCLHVSSCPTQCIHHTHGCDPWSASWVQGRGSELQQVQARAASNEGVLKASRAELNLKRDEMDDLRHQLSQGLSRVYGQVSSFLTCMLSTLSVCRDA